VFAAAHGLGTPWEVIVVDDASSDRTAARAREAGARVIAVTHRQIARTRNAGARAAHGDRLFFVDADTLVSPASILGALRALDRGAAGGGAMLRFEGPLPGYAGPVLVLLDLLMRHGKLAAGCFLFCTREAFERAGGFDETLYAGEELALSHALKRQGRFVILGDRVVTSGRKLRTHSAGEVAAFVARVVRHGVPALKSREGLEVWYGPRRQDPEDDKTALSA
jgi:glycosyltransferase involved in cell wall biosynthesis